MSAELVQLAQAGATAIVSAMATDSWGQVRTRLARLFGHGKAAGEMEALRDLDDSYAVLTSSEISNREAVSHELELEIRGQLKYLLRRDMELATELEEFVNEIRSGSPDTNQRTKISQRAKAARGATVIQAGGNVTGPIRERRL